MNIHNVLATYSEKQLKLFNNLDEKNIKYRSLANPMQQYNTLLHH